MERLLAQPPHPPPPAVGAIEPVTRGAQTIRQQLEQHRSQQSCTSCHAKFDPAGFALKNFDGVGGWRDRYRAHDKAVSTEKGFGRLGQKFQFFYGLPVDASGELAKQLAHYATGEPVRFADRAEISSP